MEDKPSESGPDTDEYGLTIQKYHSVVLVVVPSHGYREEALRHARSALYNVHVGTWSVSTETDELIKGKLQDEFMVDGPLAGHSLEPHSGVLFVDGDGVGELAANPDCLRLAREAVEQDKLLAASGGALEILVAAGVVKRRKVTGAPALADAVAAAGGRYTGVQVQVDGNLVTALDDAAGLRFGKALAAIVGI